MHRAESPSMWSLGSQETAGVASRPTTANAGQKSFYRLFPSVEPTPPASPKGTIALPKANNVSEPIRRRSSSLDETARVTATPHTYGLRQLHAARRRPSKVGMVDLKPMSTVQELPLDSPTVPSRFTFKSFASTRYSEDSYHGRSSSAPGELVREDDVSPLSPDQEALLEKTLGWPSTQTAATSKTIHGLGLTVDPTSPEEPVLRDSLAKRGPKQKPNLTVNVKRAEQPDRPPPPPPKSPRHAHKTSVHSQNASLHSRASSVQSRRSSRASSQDVSPIAIAQSVAVVRPVFVNHTRSSRESPVATESTPAESSSADDRLRNTMGSPIVERGRQIRAVFRKPVPGVPSKEMPRGAPAALDLLSSKFSVGSPTEELSTEGEKTPKATGPFEITPRPAHPYQNPAASTSSLVVPGADMDDLPPPTPRKDSFHVQNRSDGSASSAEQRPGIRRSISTATPSYFNVAASAKTDRETRDRTDDVLPPPPPSREPPKRPVSLASTAPALNSSSARTRAPTPDLSSGSLAPEPEQRLKSERLSRYDRPTPELPFRAATPDMTAKGPEDPAEVLRGLARQTEALHARYTSLRSDRQKLSTSIVSSLREAKAGPQYSNTLLDQHLSLAAINSSMDICFAKLKSLECRKEEAMNMIISQQANRRRHDRLRQAATARSHSSLRSPQSGRSTPELTVEVVNAKRSASSLRKDSATIAEVNTSSRLPEASDEGPSVRVSQVLEGSEVNEKRLTAIQSPIDGVATAEPEELSWSEAETAQPKRVRIKGAKAAKLLGLMKDYAGGRPGSLGITLPEDGKQMIAPLVPGPRGGSPAIEVHIPSSPFRLALSPPSPAPTSPLPSPPSAAPTSPLPSPPTDTRPHSPAPLKRKNTTESVSSVASSVITNNTAESRYGAGSRFGSTDESVADMTEANTPQEEEEQPMGLKSARRGQLQTIQVFVDDEILDMYQESAKK